jgi:putative ABC transport system ATP-binding protein
LNRQFHKTVLLVTHDPRASAYAKVTHYLDKGIIVPKP